MITQEKQRFSSLDFFTIIFSFGFIVYISAPIVTHHLESGGIKKAQSDISEIGKNLLLPAVSHESFLAATRPRITSKRGIASVDADKSHSQISEQTLLAMVKKQKDSGEEGLDPWGKPYQFLFVRNKLGAQTHIAVWSSGPDQKNETDVTAQLAQNAGGPISLSFQGDDVGALIPIR
jgi:hypothetical protein